MNYIPADSLLLVLELGLHKLLNSMPVGWPPQHETIEIVCRGTKATLCIGPAHLSLPEAQTPGNAPLTGCQRQILEITLRECKRLERRVIGSEIRAALKEAGISWSVSTINVALAELVSAGYLENWKDKRGYGPPTTSPKSQ